MRSFMHLCTSQLPSTMPASLPRFFSSRIITPVNYLKTEANTGKIQELALRKTEQERELQQLISQQQLSPMLSERFQNKVVYTLQTDSPATLLAKGGLTAGSSSLMWTPENGNNHGFVCFSLLPEITTIFREKQLTIDKRDCYIYAFPLSGLFWLPGGPWRQVCSPGAFPLPAWWRARKVIDIKNGKVALGEIVGQNDPQENIQCVSFTKFMQNRLRKPLLLNVADEDYPEIYDIIDTPASAAFQHKITQHYHPNKTSNRLL